MSDLPDDFDSPDELLNHLWARLASAAADRASGFHVATFGTIGVDGSPSARSIILRQVDPDTRIIRFHTDRRSPKVQELLRDPRSTMLFWDPKSQTQLRAAGVASVAIDDPATRAMIEQSHTRSLAVYRSVLAPSMPIGSPGGAKLSDQPLLENVAVISLSVTSLEWLWLDESGHRRCRFTYSGDSAVHQWLAP
jgi:hypothetical protein